MENGALNQKELDDILDRPDLADEFGVEDYNNKYGVVIDRWSKVQNSKVKDPVRLITLGNTLYMFDAPWFHDNSPEANYLSRNPAFALGAELPKGKCRKRYSKIKPTVHKLDHIFADNFRV